MKTKDGRTPREAAYDVALGWLQNAYEDETGDVEDCDDRLPVQKAIRVEIAKLYNRLLDESGMDGVELEERL